MPPFTQVMTNALLPNPFINIKQQMTKSIRVFSKELAPSIYKAFKPIGPSGLILFHHKIRVCQGWAVVKMELFVCIY